MPESVSALRDRGQVVMYYAFGLVAQTFFFGVYSVLMTLSTRMLLRGGLRAKVSRVIFGVMSFMYMLSAAYWAYSVAGVAQRMLRYIDSAVRSGSTPVQSSVLKWSPLFNAIVLVNYVLSDGVVVWRAWVICMRHHRKYIYIPMFFLGLTTISVFGTIVVRIVGLNSPAIDMKTWVDMLQISGIVLSLISNISATGVVGATAWQHRKLIRAAFSDQVKSTGSGRVLALIVESGVLYCLSGIFLLVSSLIRLPHGTLGGLYAPIHVQIAGAYPTIVILLVHNTRRSLNDATFSDIYSEIADPPPSRHIQSSHSTFVGPGTENQVINITRNPAAYRASTDSLDSFEPNSRETKRNDSLV
ncbi:hypothetical protein C8J57DRAFT_1296814 [Mycena rebaudengoi]|nr:hypothetical protein C8J57DRAFT_1296814 [Mycena rebaudengoi]